MDAHIKAQREVIERANQHWYTRRTDTELWHIAETAQQEINRRNLMEPDPDFADAIRQQNALDMIALHASAVVLNDRRNVRIEADKTDTQSRVTRWPSVGDHKEVTL